MNQLDLCEYVVWFRDETLPADDEDYEWPGVILVRGQSAAEVKTWCDSILVDYPDTFLRSAAERSSEPGRTERVVAVGEQVTAEELGF